jgi:hypothetical protein
MVPNDNSKILIIEYPHHVKSYIMKKDLAKNEWRDIVEGKTYSDLIQGSTQILSDSRAHA